jgi:hypothetical protein
MSTGVFLSIQESFIDTARDRALELVACIDRILATSGQRALRDPAEGPHVCTGRTGLDHIGSSSLVSLGEAAGPARAHAHLLCINPYRLVYIPRTLRVPQPTGARDMIAGRSIEVLVGASASLLAELQSLATDLGIPLAPDRSLADPIAKAIDDLEPLSPGDAPALVELRVAWLLMHEAARLSIEHDVPISLAG